MKQKINIAELLKDCPKGMELYSPLCGKCYFDRLNYGTIICKKQNTQEITFTSEGYYMIPVFEGAECMLFPSKDNRDWNTFQRPFKDGDIIANERYIAIFHKIGKPNNCINENIVYYHCWYNKTYNECKFKNDYGIGANTEYKFATEDEKQKLFDAIKENGYKWNEETKTLEKLPKFKVGDQIVKKNSISNSYIVNSVSCEYYGLLLPDKSGVGVLSVNEQDEWELLVTTELVPNKFNISTLKPFDKVLVRQNVSGKWGIDFFGFYNEGYYYSTGNCMYVQCIPYEKNEHLLGTTQDCDEFYKNW